MNNFRSLRLQSNLFLLKCPGGILRKKKLTFACKTEQNAVKPWAGALPILALETPYKVISTHRRILAVLSLWLIASQDVEHVTKIQLNVVNTSEERH